MKLTISAKKIADRARGLHVGKNPHLDWGILLVFFFCLNIGIIWASVYLLREVNAGEIFQGRVGTRSVVDTVSKDRLDRIISSYEEKERAFEAAKKELQTVVDPAL